MRGELAALTPNWSARYRLVGVFPLRDTPTRITSAWASSRCDAPSSCAMEKLIASMRCASSFLSRALAERPIVWLDLTPRPASSGSMKLSKKSITSAFAPRTTARTSWFTSVENTIARPLLDSAAMRATHSSAFSVLSTNGSVTWLNSTPSNWVIRLWPSICAVMRGANALVIDIFESFIDPLEAGLGVKSSHTIGRSHSAMDKKEYAQRMEAINFSMAHDDGASHRELAQADVILVGVSRSGKTP